MPWHFRPGIVGGSRGGPPTDPSFSSVKLLMGFNGANNDTGAPGMTDESSAAHGTASIAFGSPKISTSQSVFGGSSWNGSGVNSFADSADWNVSNRLFTFECRLYTTTVSGIYFFFSQWQSPGNAFAFYLQNDTLQFHLSTTGSNDVTKISTGSVMTANTWYAFCVDFDGSKYRMYLDGAMIGSSASLSTAFDSTNILMIGGNSLSSSFLWSGFIEELRLTMDVARYASDGGYTVATAAFPRS